MHACHTLVKDTDEAKHPGDRQTELRCGAELDAHALGTPAIGSKPKTGPLPRKWP